MITIDEKKLERMIDDAVQRRMSDNIYILARKSIIAHIEHIIQGELYQKLKDRVGKIMEMLYEERMDNKIQSIIRKEFPPSIIYINDTMKPPPPLIPFGVHECFVAPAGSCVYFLCKDNRIVYIGQSINLASRLGQHMLSKNFDRVFYMDVLREDLKRVEMELIKYYDPEYNRLGFSRQIIKVENERQRR
jgi:hypothetical protein